MKEASNKNQMLSNKCFRTNAFEQMRPFPIANSDGKIDRLERNKNKDDFRFR
jgi:hypothetical protein